MKNWKHYVGGVVVLAKEITEEDYNVEYSYNKKCDHQEKDWNGYAVKFPDRYVEFFTKDAFEKMFRLLTEGEYKLLEYGKTIVEKRCAMKRNNRNQKDITVTNTRKKLTDITYSPSPSHIKKVTNSVNANVNRINKLIKSK